MRTRTFGMRTLRLADAIPESRSGSIIAKQLIRCGTSVGANYRAACRARSRSEFVARMGIVEEECDEARYWMELLIEGGLMEAKLLKDLIQEADEILSLVVASIRTTRARRQSEIRNPKSEIGSGVGDVA